MARVGDTCVSIGNADWFRGDSVSTDPVAVLPNEVLRGTVGNSIVISGRSSYSEDELDVFYYEWNIEGPQGFLVPDGIDEDTEEIRLDPNLVGEYIVRLSVVGASGGCSNTAVTGVYAFSSPSPHHEGTALDMSFLWQLLPTLWSKIEQNSRLKIELFWRGLSQLIGSDLNDAMALDVAKSIMHTSSTRSKRMYKLELMDDLSSASARLWPSSTITASVIDRNTLSITDGLHFIYRVSTYSARAEIVSENAVSVMPTAGFQPYDFDAQAQITLSVGGTAHTGIVDNIISTSDRGSGSVYILTGVSLPIERVGEIIDISISPRLSSGVLPLLVDQGDGDRLVIATTNNSAQSIEHSVVAGYLSEDNLTNVRITPVLEHPDAWRQGVRKGDILTVSIREVISGSELGLDLHVAGVQPYGDVDLIAFSPLGDISFTDLLRDVCQVLIPDVVDAFRDIKSYVENIIIPRGVSATIESPFDLFIPVGSQPIRLRVKVESVTRRSAARVPNVVRELSVLREYIEIHDEDPSGEYIITESGKALFLGRRQLTLLENSDFFVEPPRSRSFDVTYNQGDTYLLSPYAVDNYVSRGDKLLDLFSSTNPAYVVAKVEGRCIYVSPLPNRSLSARPVRLESKSRQGWVFFSEDVMPHPAAPYLWAEAATIEDYITLERSFGEITGLSYDEWSRLNSRSSYLDVLRALFIGYVQGPTVSNLEGAVSAVLGAPYTTERIIIRDVTRGFRIIDGVTYTKVIAEVIDEDDKGLGLLSDFLVPESSEHVLEDMLRTTVSLSEGSIVTAGKSLSKVVSIVDHALKPHIVTDRHRFKVRLASGAVSMSPEAIRLIISYLDMVKPAHTDYALEPVHFVHDDINIESSISMLVRKELFDTSYGLHGPADVLDDYIPGIGKVDSRPFIVLSTWFPSDGSFSLTDGVTKLESPFGGFVNQPTAYTLPFQVQGATFNVECNYDAGAWIKEGDAVVLRNKPDSPVAVITDIVSDNEMLLDNEDIYWRTQFEADTDASKFIIVRFLDDLLLETQIETEANVNGLNIIELGARASNVSRGDIVHFNTTSDVPRPIERMRGTRAFVESRGYRALSSDALDLNSKIHIRRPSLRAKNRVVKLTLTDQVNHVALTPAQDSSIVSMGMLGVQVGDLVEGISPIVAIMQNQSVAIMAKIPSIPVSPGERGLRIVTPSGLEGADALDLHQTGVNSSVSIVLKDKVSTYSVGDQVDFIVPKDSFIGAMCDADHIKPGDILRLRSIERPVINLLNVGEGPGVYRVVYAEVSGDTARIKLNVNLTDVNSTRVVAYLVKQATLAPIVIRQSEV